MGKKAYFWLLIILIIASFFRLWNITTTPPGLYPDEAMNGNNAREALESRDFRIFYPENNGREGLFINIQALSLKLFGNEPWALRLVSAIFGILTVLGMYYLTKELFPENPHIPLFAAFLLATSFWHINFSRIGFRAIMAPFFLIWGFYFLFAWISRLSKTDNVRGWLPEFYAIVGGLFFGLGFHSYIAYRIAPLLLIVPLLQGLRQQSSYKLPVSGFGRGCFPCLFALFLFFALIAVLPLGYYFLQNPDDFLGRTAQVSIFSSPNPFKDLGNNVIKTIGMFFWQGDYNWRHNIAGQPQLWWPVGLLFMLGMIISLRAIIQKSKTKNYVFLWVWFLVFLIPVVISNEGIPHALRAITLIPPVILLAAIGLGWIVSTLQNLLERAIKRFPTYTNQLVRIKKELLLLLFIFFVALASHAFNQYFLRWAGNPYVANAFSERYVAIGKYLNTLPDDIKKYVIVNADGVKVRGIPMPAQTVMFIVKPKKNVVYILPEEINQLQQAEQRIVMLEEKNALRAQLKEILPTITFEPATGYLLIGKTTK